MFNKYQEAAAAAYGDGEFAILSTMEEVDRCGDTLFRFIMLELSDDEGCESHQDAVRRLEVALCDVDACLTAVAAMEVEDD